MSNRIRFMLGVTLVACSFYVAPPQAIAADEICLMDSPGGRKTKPMADCKYMEPFPGAGGQLVQTADHRNWLFKATRYRISDQMDYDSTVAYYNTMIQSGSKDEKAIYRRHIFNVATGKYELPQVYAAVRVNAGTTTVTPIDAWGICRYVQNNTNQDILVPFRTEIEWKNFREQAQVAYKGQLVLSPCSLPCPGECEDHGFFFGPTSMVEEDGDKGLDEGSKYNYFPTELPYYPTGALWPADQYDGVINRHTFNYQCKYRIATPLKCVQNGVVDSAGKCVDPVADKNCCLKYTSQCVDKTATWREVWQLERPRAGEAGLPDANGNRANGWTWPTAGVPPYYSHSFKVNNLSTPRPAECGTGLDLMMIDGLCTTPPPDPNAVTDPDPKEKKKKPDSGTPSPHTPPGGGSCKL